MLKRAVSDLASLVFPDVCPVCGSMMSDGERFVCTACRYRVPLTGFCREGSDWRRLIHDFKYGGRWLLAVRIGRWLGAELAAGGLYGDVDVVVPVPLHWRKRISRGYNQSEYIAEGVAHSLGVPCDFRSVRRRVNNPSQTQQRHGDRWGNVDGIFAVRHPQRLRGKHVLLVDDVFTTGATVISCAEAIFAACGGDVRVSVATVAASRRELGEE